MPPHFQRKSTTRKYWQIFHTADAAFHIRGDSLEEIFVHAAQALVATLTDRRRLRRRELREMEVTAPDRESLLVAWLNHLLYLYDVEGFLGRDFTIRELSDESLKAQALGDIFDPERHLGKTAVKAATYHHLEITPRDHGWQATVILDI